LVCSPHDTRLKESTVISAQLAKLLVEQVGHELGAHQAYLGISLYFERLSLDRWARLFRAQSIEEAEHASKIMAFLVDNEVAFDLPPIGGAPTQYESASVAIRTGLNSELRVTDQFNAMAGAAQAAADHRTFQFLGWFIDEQVEEERTMRRLLDLVESGINLFQAQAQLDDRDEA
jgi:ferritin